MLRTISISSLLCFVAACSIMEGGSSFSTSDTFSGGADGAEDSSADGHGDTEDTDSGGNQAGPGSGVELRGEVLFANNHGNQLHDLYRPVLNTGSAMNRIAIYARLCEDEACERVAHVLPGTINSQGLGERYALSTAGASGSGMVKDFVIPDAPAGTWYFQLIGDPERRELAGLGSCADLSDCPGPLAVLQTDSHRISQNELDERERANPPAATTFVELSSSDASYTFADTLYLGHISLPPTHVAEPADGGAGRFIVGASSASASYRNTIYLFDLATRTPDLEPVSALEIAVDGVPLEGDLCGAIEHGDTIWVLAGSHNSGLVFELDLATLQQRGDGPIASIDSPNGTDESWPCEGAYAEVGSSRFLVLAQVQGAGSLNTSSPWPVYLVDLDTGDITTPFEEELGDAAVRSVAFDHHSNRVFFYDMNWSKSSKQGSVNSNRIFSAELKSDGSFTALEATTIPYSSEGECAGPRKYPSHLSYVDLDGEGMLLAGHDTGVATYRASDLSLVSNLELPQHGRLFTRFVESAAGQIYAMPSCKAWSNNSTFALPSTSGEEVSDSNMIAILEWREVNGKPQLAVADTTLDIDEDGAPDNGLDLDYYDVKRFIRMYAVDAPIPPVVFTAPSFTLAGDFAIVRGSGVQEDDQRSFSSSGLGQASDLSIIDRRTGHGVIFRDYKPFLDGPSARWGLSIRPGVESSTAFVMGLR